MGVLLGQSSRSTIRSVEPTRKGTWLEPIKNKYRCATCGKWHEGPALAYGFEAPAVYYQIPAEQRQDRCELSSDTCAIDMKHFFIVGNLEIPIIGRRQKFVWSPWVSLSEKNFKRVGELWEQPGRETEPPYFGWLSSIIPGYPTSEPIATRVHTRMLGIRPRIELEPTEFQLSKDQVNGITWERALELDAMAMHASKPARK